MFLCSNTPSKPWRAVGPEEVGGRTASLLLFHRKTSQPLLQSWYFFFLQALLDTWITPINYGGMSNQICDKLAAKITWQFWTAPPKSSGTNITRPSTEEQETGIYIFSFFYFQPGLMTQTFRLLLDCNWNRRRLSRCVISVVCACTVEENVLILIQSYRTDVCCPRSHRIHGSRGRNVFIYTTLLPRTCQLKAFTVK